MRKLLLGSIAGIALIASGGAQAADVAVKAPAVPAVAAVDWTGIYVGGHGGYAGSRERYLFTDDTATTEDVRFSPNSFVGGGQVGIQWQYEKWVLGLEGTYSGVDLNQTFASVLSPGQTRTIHIGDIATATVRFGSTWDRVMLYAKGGYAGVRTSIQSTDPVLAISMNTTGWRSGWTVGAGLEYMAWQNLMVGLEFDYYNFQFDTTGLYNDGVTPFTVAGSVGDIYAVTARVSYLLW